MQSLIGMCTEFINAEKCCVDSLHDHGIVSTPNLFYLENALYKVHYSGLSTGLFYCTAFLVDDR